VLGHRGDGAQIGLRPALDFFLSGRSMPAWGDRPRVHLGETFGAVEIFGIDRRTAAQVRRADRATTTVIGAVPAMGLPRAWVMMPFYYGSKVAQRAGVPVAAASGQLLIWVNGISFAVAQGAHRRQSTSTR